MVFTVISNAVTSFAAQPADSIYISDLSQCLPADAVASNREKCKWRLIPYEADGVAGTMLYADSFIDAPEVVLPIRRKGWYKIYIAYWYPEYSYDGSPILKVKLNGDRGFRRFLIRSKPDTQNSTFLQEIYYTTADLEDRDLVIGKCNGLLAANASLAYVRLVPLTEEEIMEVKRDREQTQTRNLVATIDGASYFHYGQYDRPEDIIDQVASYERSDVAKVLWAATYGYSTNFPTRIPGAKFLGNSGRLNYGNGVAANDYMRGSLQMYQTLGEFAEHGIVAQQIAAEETHRMGLKFDLMYRLGIIGGNASMIWPDDGLIQQNPELCQVMQDGTPVNKASYAYEEVQDFVLAQIRESLALIDADGINLCFVRGPHFIRFEQPVLKAFHVRYGEDARNISPDDPRLGEVRALFMTKFVRSARELLDEIGKKQGKDLTLSIWVWPETQGVWLGDKPALEGLAVEDWIKEGLLDSVICQQGISEAYMALGKEHGCEFVLYTGYRGDKAMSPESVTQAYEQGVENFAYWDIDSVQMFDHHWNWLSRIGHREEMANWADYDPGKRTIQLRTVDGIGVDKTLAQDVYSGG